MKRAPAGLALLMLAASPASVAAASDLEPGGPATRCRPEAESVYLALRVGGHVPFFGLPG